MRAKDMPYAAKQKLLQQIESQIGSIEYDKLVGRLGEDGLIDFALEKGEEAAKKEKGFRPNYGGILVFISVVTFWCWVAGIKNVLALIGMYLGLGLVYWLFGSLSKWWDNFNRPFR